MPKLNTDDEMQTHSLGNNFSFSSTPLERLVDTEYTLASILVDVTYSTFPFAAQLNDALKTSIKALQKSPRASNLLVRVGIFSTSVGIQELHGFKLLSDIDVDKYPQFQPDGATNLFDAVYSAVSATSLYAEDLKKNDYLANAIVFVITDGDDNRSRMTADSIKRQIEKIKANELLESILVFLIGVNDKGCKHYLDAFERNADLDGYVSVDEATPGKLAKLAKFVATSVSSQSQSLGTGGPSQSIAATI